jgi:hypothetical protein
MQCTSWIHLVAPVCRVTDKTFPLNSSAIDTKPLTPSMVSWVQTKWSYGYTFALSPFCFSKWYDPFHIITWPSRSIDLDFTCSSPLHRSVGSKSCSSFTIAWSFASKPWLALHLHNRSIEQSLILVFTILVTWVNVMSHIQWSPLSKSST